MGFGGGGSSSEKKPRDKPPEGTYAPRPDHDPINTQLGIEDPASDPLLRPKPKRTPMVG